MALPFCVCKQYQCKDIAAMALEATDPVGEYAVQVAMPQAC